MIRYVKSFDWSIKETYDRLVETEKWRKEKGFFDINPSDLDSEFSMKFAYVYGYDKVGRPIVYLRANKYNP